MDQLGVEELYLDRANGKNTQRPQLQQMLVPESKRIRPLRRIFFVYQVLRFANRIVFPARFFLFYC